MSYYPNPQGPLYDYNRPQAIYNYFNNQEKVYLTDVKGNGMGLLPTAYFGDRYDGSFNTLLVENVDYTRFKLRCADVNFQSDYLGFWHDGALVAWTDSNSATTFVSKPTIWGNEIRPFGSEFTADDSWGRRIMKKQNNRRSWPLLIHRLGIDNAWNHGNSVGNRNPGTPQGPSFYPPPFGQGPPQFAPPQFPNDPFSTW